MTEVLVDLSVPVDPSRWEPNPIKVTMLNHRRGGDVLGRSLIKTDGKTWLKRVMLHMQYFFGLGVDHKDFPGQKGLSLMTYTLTTHTGTHLDAPFHYGDKNKEGEAARTISEVPLSWCYGDGVMLDVSQGSFEQSVGVEEVVNELVRIGYSLKPLDIVLIKTGGDKYVGQPEYFTRFRGVTLEATSWLVEQGIKVIGIDSFGFDAPFDRMLKNYLHTRNPECLWPAHIYGRENEYCQIERLTNLDMITRPFGFKVACFPINLTNADAAWCRAVAIL